MISCFQAETDYKDSDDRDSKSEPIIYKESIILQTLRYINQHNKATPTYVMFTEH